MFRRINLLSSLFKPRSPIPHPAWVESSGLFSGVGHLAI
jgi:hypothetical protein